MFKRLDILYNFHMSLIYFFSNPLESRDSLKIGICLISIYMWVIQTTYCLSIGLYNDFIICLTEFIFLMMILFLLKYTRINSDLCFNIAIFTTILALLGANINAGMGVNPSMMFFCAIPLFAIPLCGFKKGVYWSLFSMVLSATCMALAKKYNFSWNEFDEKQWYNVGLTNLFSGPLLMLGIFGYYYLMTEKLSGIIAEKNKILEKRNVEKDNLVRVLTHDISRNVSLLSSNLEMENKGLSDTNTPSMVRHYLENIKTILKTSPEIKDSLRSTKQLLDHDSLKLYVEKSFAREANQKQVKVKTRIFDKFSIPIIQEHFELHIIGNLVSNAIKFADTDSEVFVDIYNDHVSVENHGIPYTPDQEVAGRGHGFGLAIVREFSHVNGLQFHIESQNRKTTASIRTK